MKVEASHSLTSGGTASGSTSDSSSSSSPRRLDDTKTNYLPWSRMALNHRQMSVKNCKKVFWGGKEGTFFIFKILGMLRPPFKRAVIARPQNRFRCARRAQNVLISSTAKRSTRVCVKSVPFFFNSVVLTQLEVNHSKTNLKRLNTSNM